MSAAAASTAALAGLAELLFLSVLPIIHPFSWPLSAGITIFTSGWLVLSVIVCLRIAKLLIEGKDLTTTYHKGLGSLWERRPTINMRGCRVGLRRAWPRLGPLEMKFKLGRRKINLRGILE